MWQDPEPGEIRGSGYAYYSLLNGTVVEVPSCRRCAWIVRASWQEALFEGVCRGCECVLSGNA